MHITTAKVKEIRLEFAKLKPVKVTLDGNRSLTVKEAVFALAPTLERMKKRGFDIQEIAEKLREKGIEVKPATLTKYLSESRRGKDRKTDTPPPTQTPHPPRKREHPPRITKDYSSLHQTRHWNIYKGEAAWSFRAACYRATEIQIQRLFNSMIHNQHFLNKSA